jgi:hypothetical protein
LRPCAPPHGLQSADPGAPATAGTSSARCWACTTNSLWARSMACSAITRSQVGRAGWAGCSCACLPCRQRPLPPHPIGSSWRTAWQPPTHRSPPCPTRPGLRTAAPLFMSAVQFAAQCVIARTVLWVQCIERQGGPMTWPEWGRNGAPSPPPVPRPPAPLHATTSPRTSASTRTTAHRLPALHCINHTAL